MVQHILLFREIIAKLQALIMLS